MPFALLIVGILVIVSAVRGTTAQLGTLVAGDFTGPGNFVYWMLAIIIIGAVGYIPKVQPLSVAFITLLILVLVLARGNPNSAGGGFFQKFVSAIGVGTTQPAATPVQAGSLGGKP